MGSARINITYYATIVNYLKHNAQCLESEISSLDIHYKKTIESLQKLYPATPSPVVHFLGGSLPAPALLHLTQFSLLSMISRLENSIILKHGLNILSSNPPPPKSWFTQVNSLCAQYSLPPALSLLSQPLPKNPFKNKVKKAVFDFWEQKLRKDTSSLSSLKYFKSQFHSLSKPHLIWSSVGTNPYEVNKAVIQARMLSGRYRCEQLRRHWSNNPGYCELEPCFTQSVGGSLEHMLLDCRHCPALGECRQSFISLCQQKLEHNSYLKNIFVKYLDNNSIENQAQFILDPSVLPDVIRLIQDKNNDAVNLIFYLTRTYCHSVHKTKMKLLGLCWSP